MRRSIAKKNEKGGYTQKKTEKKKSNNVHMTRRNLKDLQRNNDNLTQVKGRQGLLIQGRKVTQVTNAKE